MVTPIPWTFGNENKCNSYFRSPKASRVDTTSIIGTGHDLGGCLGGQYFGKGEFKTVPDWKGQCLREGTYWKSSLCLEILNPKGKWKWGSIQLHISIGGGWGGEGRAPSQVEVWRETDKLDNQGQMEWYKVMISSKGKQDSPNTFPQS